MSARFCSMFFLAVGSVCMALGGAIYMRSEPTGPVLIVDQPNPVLIDPTPDATPVVEFTIRNPTGRPHRIVGADYP
jgi:hypothetical protein